MITDTVVQHFTLEGKEVVFRHPRFNDMDTLLALVNAIVDERAMVVSQKKLTKEEELEWLFLLLQDIKSGKVIHLVVEMDGEIVGNANVAKNQGVFDHTGTLGIMLRREVRRKGIGEKLFLKIIEEARRVLDVSIITLRVMGSNEVAQRLYRKCGFKEIGRVPGGVRHYGKFEDDVSMVKYL